MPQNQKKILVVDDDQEILAFLRAYLESNGYDVYVAASAKQGLRMALQFKPDLVILDVMMPDAGGLTVYQQIRDARGPSEPIPILIFSAAPSMLISGQAKNFRFSCPGASRLFP